jgi:thioredoxin 1
MTNVLYFSTTWCGPCKMFKPVVEQVSQETGKYVQFIDAEQNKLMAEKYGVTSVPTMIITDDGGNVVRRLNGVQSKPALVQLFSTI